jgi:hypothetical protein
MERLLAAAARLGISGPAALAKAMNESDQTVTNWSKRGVSKAGAIKAQGIFGVSSAKIITGEDQSFQPITALAPTPAPGAPAISVPLLANAGSMGPGTEIQHDDVLVGHIALSEQWVARRLKPTSPTALRFIHAYGDSMHPTFEDGDVLLVDTGMRDPKAIDGVYVMSANDRVYIKRVRQRMDGVVEISSDNPTVKTVDVLNGDHRIDILGRVVWCWNGRKL